MKNNKFVIISVILSFFGVFLLGNSCAAVKFAGEKNIITKVKDLVITGSEWNCNGAFYPTFNWGSRCKFNNSNTCGESVKKFKCITSGTHPCGDEGDIKTVKVEKASNAFVNEFRYHDDKVYASGHPNFKKYAYYKVTISTTGQYQNVQGIVHMVRRFTLTAKSVDTEGKLLSSVQGLKDKKNTALYDHNASATRGTNAKYKFLGWDTDVTIDKPATVNVEKTDKTFTAKMTKNRTIYAVYEKIIIPPPDPDSCDVLLPYVPNEVVTGTWVKNTSIDKYNESWHTGESDPVWAKPEDKIKWMNCYNSDIYSEMVNQSTVNNVDPPHDTNLSGTQNHVNNNLVGNWLSWTNKWDVSGANYYSKSYNVSSHTTDKFPNDSDVTSTWIGRTTNETSRTGSPTKISISSSDHSWACHWGVVGSHKETTSECEEKDEDGECIKYKEIDVTDYGYQDTCSHDDSYYKTEWEGQRSAKALVNVPYNYENRAKIYDDDDGGDDDDEGEEEEEEGGEGSSEDAYDIAYAGEERDGISFTLKTLPHNNENTEGEYATASPNTQYRFNTYVEGVLHNQTTPVTYPMNLGNNPDGDKVTIGNGVVITPDVAAGTVFCVSVSVYPGSSGDYDMTGNGDGTWVESDDQRCFIVAKRPSLQVWGGNVFSRGIINTSVANKLEVAGYPVNRIFGSFGELGLISSGATKGFASASSTGYGNISGGTLSPNPFNGVHNNTSNTSDPGGSSKSSICNRSQLTFANSPCSKLGQVGKTSTTTNLEEDKNNILGKFIKELDSPNTDSHVVLNDRNKAQADGTYYYYSDSDLEVGNNATEVSVASSTIQMVHSKGTVFVRGNIVYGDTYKKYSELPKLVLYGKNVVIDCNVTRIDALIIANEKVVTCNNYNNVSLNGNDTNLKDAIENRIDDRINSQQLKINGAVVAKTLIANRTYGAATGANSIVPAEIINFDPTLYMWGGLGNEEGSDGDLDITMLRELAPRK